VLEPFDLNLRHLDAVVAVAEARSISAAALAVNMSQPALTQAIARLEQRLGRPLFERQPQGVRPTRAGDLFLPRAARGLARLTESIGATAARRGCRRWRIRSGRYRQRSCARSPRWNGRGASPPPRAGSRCPSLPSTARRASWSW
jgi:DNA-binding transcriptional LysR family regulator